MNNKDRIAPLLRVALVGPFPEPINGCSYANEVLYRRGRELGHSFVKVNTTTSQSISGRQGSVFSFRKFISFVAAYRRLPIILGADVTYITPGQTFFGLLKYAPFMAVSRLLQVPYVIHLHGNHLGSHYSTLRGIKRELFRICISRADAAIVLSESLRANFSELLPPECVHVVENFAGDDLFTSKDHVKDSSEMRVLYLSNLMREKGILELLDALALLKEKGIPFSAQIAGHMEEGIRGSVESRLALLVPEVTYIGPVSGQTKIDALHRSNVLVLPTYYSMEGQPIALLEGMACGNVLVTTRHAGIPDIVEETNGHLLPVRDIESISSCLEYISNNLESEIARVSEHNSKKAAERYTEARFADSISKLLQRIKSSKAKDIA
ncbi:glycosyltransferase family 4 protein [Stenotrophomonas maltophilia]|uniref:glycosyltransferase family 4 protein n=1 Tax=Stenotrophomonas maltophilia TaxID=40324 RepID=UPI0013D9A22D|nr:glycosyltransferase family 4 protein [Stenotrophomonas maltophilia]